MIYLFRADMSGVYLTLNQATSWIMRRYTADGAGELMSRASELRKRALPLTEIGFTVDEGIDLRSRADTARGYQASTVAFKLYERNMIPSDDTLFSDLEGALQVYETLIPSRRVFDFW
jgi:5-methylcytosine-specific restriction protein A